MNEVTRILTGVSSGAIRSIFKEMTQGVGIVGASAYRHSPPISKGKVMRFSLIPREEKFFDMFDEVAAILTRAAGKFHNMVKDYDLKDFEGLEAKATELKFEEHVANDAVERIIKALDRSFITPFDREDIHTLATSLDDVLDNMEETANRFVMFRIDKPTPEAISMVRIIKECCQHLEQAVQACRTLKNPQAVQNHLKEIGHLENEADQIYRDTERKLFANPPPDILLLIKWREVYSLLEATVDACKNASQVISEIVIKGS